MEDLVKELKEIYNKKFNNSLCHSSYGCFGKDTIFIQLYLAKEDNEVFNRIWANDMFSIMFSLKQYGNDYKLEKVQSAYTIKTTNKYLYCEHKKVAYRVTIGNEDKIKQAFKKYVDRLYESILEDVKNDNIHYNYVDLVNKKLGL